VFLTNIVYFFILFILLLLFVRSSVLPQNPGEPGLELGWLGWLIFYLNVDLTGEPIDLCPLDWELFTIDDFQNLPGLNVFVFQAYPNPATLAGYGFEPVFSHD
jgi:hypothetical protein